MKSGMGELIQRGEKQINKKNDGRREKRSELIAKNRVISKQQVTSWPLKKVLIIGIDLSLMMKFVQLCLSLVHH
jgi:hypothetical protein